MYIGQLRCRVTLQKCSAVVPENPNYYRWADEKKLWAKIEEKRNSEGRYLFTLRRNKVVTPHDGISYNGQFFKIIGINESLKELGAVEVQAVQIIPKICRVKRIEDGIGFMNRPNKETTIIGEYPCELTRKSVSEKQKEPHTHYEETYMLKTMYGANIISGDLIEIDEIVYVAGVPFRQTAYATEVEISVRSDA